MEDFLILNVRSNSTGVGLYLKSEYLYNFFKASHKKMIGILDDSQITEYNSHPNWGKAFFSPDEAIFNQFQYWGGRLYEKGKPNLSFLLSNTLNTGTSFSIRTIMSESMLDKYIEDFKYELAYVYKEYLLPFELAQIITDEDL